MTECGEVCMMISCDSDIIDSQQALLVDTKTTTDSTRTMVRLIVYLICTLATCVGAAYQTVDEVWAIPIIHGVCACIVMCGDHWVARSIVGVGEIIALWISYHYQLPMAWLVFNGIGVSSIFANEVWLCCAKKGN